MAVEGGIVVTESSRGKLWKLLSVLGWSEALVGVTLAVIVSRPVTTLSAHLPRFHHDLLHVFYAELIVGLTSAVVSVQGVLVSQASLHNPLMKSTTRAYKTWLVLGVVLVVSLVVALLVIPPAVEAGQIEIKEVMKGGISHYLSSSEWKISLDKLHQDFQCCGIYSISDWYTSRWIPIRSFRPEVSDLQDVLSEDGTLGARVVPPSCCNPDVRLPCFHDTLQQNSTPLNLQTALYPETVFTRGCGSLVVDPAVSIVGPFKILAISIILLQAGQLVIGRYLYTDARKAFKETIPETELGCPTSRKPERCNHFSPDSCGATSPRALWRRCVPNKSNARRRKCFTFPRKEPSSGEKSCVNTKVKKFGKVIKQAGRSMLNNLASCSHQGSDKWRTRGGMINIHKLMEKRGCSEEGTIVYHSSVTMGTALSDTALSLVTNADEASGTISPNTGSHILSTHPVMIDDRRCRLNYDTKPEHPVKVECTDQGNARVACIKPAKYLRKLNMSSQVKVDNPEAPIAPTQPKLRQSAKEEDSDNGNSEMDLLNLDL